MVECLEAPLVTMAHLVHHQATTRALLVRPLLWDPCQGHQLWVDKWALQATWAPAVCYLKVARTGIWDHPRLLAIRCRRTSICMDQDLRACLLQMEVATTCDPSSNSVPHL